MLHFVSVFLFIFLFGAEYCEVREYDETDVNRIQYTVMHHLNRMDKQEIYRGLVQGLNKQQSPAKSWIKTVISGFDNLEITSKELNHVYIPDDNKIKLG